MRAALLLILAACLSNNAFAQSTTLSLRDSAIAKPIFLFAPARIQPDFSISKDAASKHLPFFCGQELKMDKLLPMPLRFRLGSQQQADWLESKPAVQRPQ